MPSVSLFISGQNNDCFVYCLQLSIPKRPWWTKDFISTGSMMGTTIPSEAAIQRCSYKKFFWKHAANLQENTLGWSVISIRLFCNFIEITFRHGCSPVNLLHIFRTPFAINTSGRLLLIRSFFSKTSSQKICGYEVHFWPFMGCVNDKRLQNGVINICLNWIY